MDKEWERLYEEAMSVFIWRVSDKLCISLKLPSGIISNPRKPVKTYLITLTGFRGFSDSFYVVLRDSILKTTYAPH